MKHLDETPLTFGKYKGKTPDEISDLDPSYIVWMYDTIKPHLCSEAMYKYCKRELKEYEQEKEDDRNFGLDGW